MQTILARVAFQIKKSLEGTQRIIDMCMKHSQQTQDLAALKVAFDGYCTLGERTGRAQSSTAKYMFDLLLHCKRLKESFYQLTD